MFQLFHHQWPFSDHWQHFWRKCCQVYFSPSVPPCNSGSRCNLPNRGKLLTRGGTSLCGTKRPPDLSRYFHRIPRFAYDLWFNCHSFCFLRNSTSFGLGGFPSGVRIMDLAARKPASKKNNALIAPCHSRPPLKGPPPFSTHPKLGPLPDSQTTRQSLRCRVLYVFVYPGPTANPQQPLETWYVYIYLCISIPSK